MAGTPSCHQRRPSALARHGRPRPRAATRQPGGGRLRALPCHALRESGAKRKDPLAPATPGRGAAQLLSGTPVSSHEARRGVEGLVWPSHFRPPERWPHQADGPGAPVAPRVPCPLPTCLGPSQRAGSDADVNRAAGLSSPDASRPGSRHPGGPRPLLSHLQAHPVSTLRHSRQRHALS